MKKIGLVGIFLSVSWMCLLAQSKYISRVYEFRPAPGQFVNVLPEYEEGDNEKMMRIKAEEAIADHAQEMISLGSWGGYVTFGFDHMLVNLQGEYDLKIFGNALIATNNPKDTTALGGSAEPGIVMVSYDSNGNGMPDDEWYELAGSEHTNPMTRHNYSVTYYRTPDDHVATPDKENKAQIDTTYIRWQSSLNEVGYVVKNSFHRQDYFPMWIDEDEMTFQGTRLRDNGKEESGENSYYVQYLFDWGYADNQPNYMETDAHASEFNLEWAIDKDGKPVSLTGVHFIRVYTAVLQQNGWLGECSTEIMDAWDLHPEAEAPMDVKNASLSAPIEKVVRHGELLIYRDGVLYNVLGHRL